jgi:hypothetical protein
MQDTSRTECKRKEYSQERTTKNVSVRKKYTYPSQTTIQWSMCPPHYQKMLMSPKAKKKTKITYKNFRKQKYPHKFEKKKKKKTIKKNSHKTKTPKKIKKKKKKKNL